MKRPPQRLVGVGSRRRVADAAQQTGFIDPDRDRGRLPPTVGATPHTSWIAETVALDRDGFILTGADAGSSGLLETSVRGIYAAGDVRSGSVKRCATAVGEGAMVVRFVHEQMAQISARETVREALGE